MADSSLDPIRSAVRRMKPYVPGEQPGGDGWIKLNQNESPYPPAPGLAEAVRAEVDALPLYGDPANRAVRDAAAAALGIDAGWITATNGSDEILRLLCQACVGEGERVVSFNPGFTYYQTLSEVQGARYELAELTDDFGLPDPLPDLSDARLVFLPNPNAQTGNLFPEAEIRRLIESVTGGFAVIDEAYADFAGANSLPLLEEYDHLVITRTLSKSYALAGLRVGLGIARPEILAELDKVRDYYNLDRLAQAGGAAALRDQAYLRETVERICATRDRFVAELGTLGLHAYPSAANFVLVRFESPSAKEVGARLRARKILVRYFDKPRLDDCLRISIGTDAHMDALLDALREMLA